MSSEVVPEWFKSVLEKGGDIGSCLAYLREQADREEESKDRELEHKEKIVREERQD